MSKKNYYTTLGVKPGASQEKIKRAYQKMRKKHHPDFNPGNEEAARAKMKEINEAYAALSGPKIRLFEDDKPRRRRYPQPGTAQRTHRAPGHSQTERNRVKRALILLGFLAALILITDFIMNLQQPDDDAEYYEDYEEDMTQEAIDSGRLPASGVAFCTVITIRDTYGYEPDRRTSVGLIPDGTELIIVPGADEEWAKMRNRTYGDFIRLSDVEVLACEDSPATPRP